MGADLSDMFISTGKFQTDLKLRDAIYNSEVYNFFNGPELSFILTNYHSCSKKHYLPPTKFPEGFDPEKYGMIDISKF